jgi:hypothetical protein
MPAVYRPQVKQQEASFRCVEVITVENESSEPKNSIRKIEANRENAQKSTGPQTAQGKYNSSRNATKHGLLSKELVIRGGDGKESSEEFEQLFAELIEDLQPEGRSELLLVETVAICEWRFRRTLRAETAEIVNGIDLGLGIDRVLPNAEAMSNILRYQTTIYRQKMQAMELLEKLQQRRRNRPRSSAATEPNAEAE